MKTFTPRLLRALCLAAASLTLMAIAALGADRSAKDKDKAAPPAVDASQYVGSETCKGCHEDLFKNFETTPHWKTTYNHATEKQGCEGCHGPGKAHVEGGGDKSKIFVFTGAKPEDVSRRCLGCHQYGEEHANFDRSQHNLNSVTCISCHSPHHAKEPQYLLVEKQPQLCYSCHTEVKQDFSRPFRHRVESGLVQCTDCHNQHGGFLTKQLRATAAQDEVCFKCHTDKAGPFAYEHEPVKTEGCVACHTPHGSTNARLLKRTEVNLLCLECHTLTTDTGAPALPSFHNQSQKYAACTMCHTQIHGSNFDATFFK
ncbi:MAG TPA: DmsE family decaheme c-type cytochrome [Candidatus Binatia bacterium]|nr:DmsE family decaheme c-type cytochrome [Candidatus Binatia bacterium]